MSSIDATHFGSLPRTQEVVDFICSREKHEPYGETSMISTTGNS